MVEPHIHRPVKNILIVEQEQMEHLKFARILL